MHFCRIQLEGVTIRTNEYKHTYIGTPVRNWRYRLTLITTRGGSRKNRDIRIYDHAHLTTPKFLLCNPEIVLGFNRKEGLDIPFCSHCNAKIILMLMNPKQKNISSLKNQYNFKHKHYSFVLLVDNIL